MNIMDGRKVSQVWKLAVEGSRTTKQADCSSTDQGGGKRRGMVARQKKLRAMTRSLTGGEKKEERRPPVEI
jgi:hypothetical protein